MIGLAPPAAEIRWMLATEARPPGEQRVREVLAKVGAGAVAKVAILGLHAIEDVERYRTLALAAVGQLHEQHVACERHRAIHRHTRDAYRGLREQVIRGVEA